MSWQPIETAPKVMYPMIVAIAQFDDGYVTDPWCVFWQEGKWQRWPHSKPPTHWCALDPFPLDEREMKEMELRKIMKEIRSTMGEPWHELMIEGAKHGQY